MEAGALPRVAQGRLGLTPPRVARLGSDARLVSMIRDGRDGAFDALYERHSRAILSFCRHMLGDAYEAEDAVQHTFMAAYRELAYTSKDVNVRPWLFTIARNRCYSILRARREQPTDDLDFVSTEGLASEVQRREDLRALLVDMANLPEEQRAALVLSELDSLSHAEIAEVLGVRTDKVKALVFQARSSLIAEKSARDTPCAEIREQLSCGRGAVLRRANLRKHLRSCDGCRDFRSQVEHQRRQIRILLPFGPSLALKELIIGAAAIGGGGAAAVGGGAVVSGAVKGGLIKTLLAGIALTAGGAGTALVVATGGIHLSGPVGALGTPTHVVRSGGHPVARQPSPSAPIASVADSADATLSRVHYSVSALAPLSSVAAPSGTFASHAKVRFIPHLPMLLPKALAGLSASLLSGSAALGTVATAPELSTTIPMLTTTPLTVAPVASTPVLSTATPSSPAAAPVTAVGVASGAASGSAASGSTGPTRGGNASIVSSTTTGTGTTATSTGTTSTGTGTTTTATGTTTTATGTTATGTTTTATTMTWTGTTSTLTTPTDTGTTATGTTTAGTSTATTATATTATSTGTTTESTTTQSTQTSGSESDRSTGSAFSPGLSHSFGWASGRSHHH